MYDVIQLSSAIMNDRMFESMSIADMLSNSHQDIDDKIYTEAVFAGGKKSVEPIVEKIQKLKDILEEEVSEQKENSKTDGKGKKTKFDPVKFWRNPAWKELEDELVKIFGFRNVDIEPYQEYIASKDIFESNILNCAVYNADRFPIDGLVTDSGFYDKSRSINITIIVSLGLLRNLDAEEVLGVFLHEFGHAIDPALVHISYTETNILSKYITDRKGSLTKHEKKAIENSDNKMKKHNVVPGLIILGILCVSGIASLIDILKRKIIGKEKYIDKKIDKIRKAIAADKSTFDRQHYSEAFADNFARMYGYGPQLMSGLKKLSKDTDNMIRSRIKKERDRENFIIEMTIDLINDVHKTDIHRIRNLIKEYKNDLNDPNIPKEVKKQIQNDLDELEKVFNEYLNNFSDMQNRVNKVINEELDKIEVKEESDNKNKDNSKDDDSKEKAIKEGFEYFEESSEAYKKLLEAEKTLNSAERKEVIEKFGHSKKCSFGKDNKGYYCFTHRCRSKSYPTIKDIPMKDVNFVRSTA